ncbi:hypothetical protein [Flocculibacter collagenilyticus]|uniref:hypothetical protein n=1 Tax=Flocculibacter collagenilyticus TaxID=2744479 RepID=UPI0018F7862F|nr:hypothetical protein [Flocculibacter collagenilyticus]
MNHPDIETNYLKNNALNMFFLSIFFIVSAAWPFIDRQAIPGAIYILMSLGLLAIIITALTFGLKSIKGLSKEHKQAFWYGQFSDEYLNFVNLQGYKYAFNIAISALLITWLTAILGFSLTFQINTLLMVHALLAIIFLSYSLRVLYLLRAEDE